jgi:hypothetical protein
VNGWQALESVVIWLVCAFALWLMFGHPGLS